MKAFDIVGYTYQGDTLCPRCMIERMIIRGEAGPTARDMDVESVLDQIAEANAIDRMDEHTFDTDTFPKVIFSSQTEGDTCHLCGREL